MLQISKVLVRAHLEYAIAAWSPWHKKDIEVLERIQHRATRRISDVRGSYSERLAQLQLTTLEDRRARGDAIEVYKYLRGYLDVDKESIFKINHTMEPKTRHQHSFMPLEIQKANLVLRKNFFSIRGSKIWNRLPSSVRDSKSVNAFKNAYDRHTKNC